MLKCLCLPLDRPGYESVPASHRPSLPTPTPPTGTITPSPSGDGRGSDSPGGSSSLPRTQGAATQEQLTSNTPPGGSGNEGSPPQPTQPNQQPQQNGSSESTTPTIVVSTNSQHRRRTRQQMYMSRNTLHQDLQLPDGYGEYLSPFLSAACLHCAPCFCPFQSSAPHLKVKCTSSTGLRVSAPGMTPGSGETLVMLVTLVIKQCLYTVVHA